MALEEKTIAMLICEKCRREYTFGKKICPIDGEQLVEAPPDTLVDTVFAEHYLILERVGGGGIAGAVYKARHQDTQDEVAIRIYSGTNLSHEVIEQFNVEAKSLAAIQHPNILPVLSFGVTPDGQPFFITRYLSGITLDSFIEFRGRMDFRRALQLFVQAAGKQTPRCPEERQASVVRKITSATRLSTAWRRRFPG